MFQIHTVLYAVFSVQASGATVVNVAPDADDEFRDLIKDLVKPNHIIDDCIFYK